MLNVDDKIKDNLKDKISKVTAKMMAKKTWDGECKTLFELLEKELTIQKHKEFIGDCRYYHLTKKGQACLYDVPVDQRGYLAEYRGKRIRLICMGSINAYSERFYQVSVVSS
jgi:hypothetical protein